MYNMTRGAITFEIERTPNRLRVTASDSDGHVARGELANSGGERPRIYPRMEFWFHQTQRWIEPACDRRYWNLDDYETGEITRPLDHGQFDLTAAEVADLQAWCDAQQPVSTQQPAAQHVSAAQPVEPIFAIGGLNRGDGAELQMPWPKSGSVCQRCGQAESDGAMFTTIGGDICDDCA